MSLNRWSAAVTTASTITCLLLAATVALAMLLDTTAQANARTAALRQLLPELRGWQQAQQDPRALSGALGELLAIPSPSWNEPLPPPAKVGDLANAPTIRSTRPDAGEFAGLDPNRFARWSGYDLALRTDALSREGAVWTCTRTFDVPADRRAVVAAQLPEFAATLGATATARIDGATIVVTKVAIPVAASDLPCSTANWSRALRTLAGEAPAVEPWRDAVGLELGNRPLEAIATAASTPEASIDGDRLDVAARVLAYVDLAALALLTALIAAFGFAARHYRDSSLPYTFRRPQPRAFVIVLLTAAAIVLLAGDDGPRTLAVGLGVVAGLLATAVLASSVWAHRMLARIP